MNTKQIMAVWMLLALLLTTAQAQTSWKGTSSTSWSTAANWTAGVPTSTVDAIIGDASFTGPNQPTISGSSANCRALTLGAGAITSVLTVSKGLTISGNTTIGANGRISHTVTTAISVKGNWTNSGSYAGTRTGSAVTFSGTAQNIAGTTATGFRRLNINAGSVTTLTRNISVTNTLSVSGTLDSGAGSGFTISGAGVMTVANGGKILVRATTFAVNFAMTGTKTLSAGSTMDYAALGDQSVTNSLTYSTLRISGSGIKTLSGNLTALVSSSSTVGAIEVSAGTLDLSTFTASRGTSVAGGSVTVAAGATLKIGGTGTFPANYATHALSAVSTIEYGGANQTMTVENYGHLTLSGSSGTVVKTMPASPLTVAGNLTVSQNTATMVAFSAGAVMTVSGNVTLGTATTFNGSTFAHSIGGNWTNSGTFTGGSSTLTMNGVNTVLAGAGANNFFNLVISRSGISADTNTSLNVAGDFSTTGAGTFNHTTGGTGSVTMSGTTKSISGSGITFSRLTISGSISTAASFTVADNLLVNGSLTASGGTITLSGAGKTIAGSGTIAFSALNVSGSVTTTNTFSFSGNFAVPGSFSATAGTVTATGTTLFSGTASFFNVTLNGTLLQLSADSVIRLAGATALIAGNFDVTNQRPNTVVYNSASSQSVYPITYDNLEIAAGGAKSAIGNINVRGSFTIDAGAVFAGGAGGYTNYLRKDWLNYGTFTAGNSIVEMVGPDDATITGATTFNQLRVNKDVTSQVIQLGTNQIVATLDMASGTMDTGTNTLTLTTTRTGNGSVFGIITRLHSFTTGVAYAFESPFNTITFASLTSVSFVTVVVAGGTVGDFPSGAAVNRQYTVSLSSSGAYNATLRTHYDDGELNGNSEAAMSLWKNSGGGWALSGKTGNDAANNWIEQSSLTNLTGRWAMADNSGVVRWNGSVSTAWETAANWTVVSGSASQPPTTNDIVELGTTNGTFQPTISSAASSKSISFGSAQAITLTLGSGGSLQTIGNVAGAWTNNITHTINVGAQTLSVGGDLALGDGTSGHAINLNISSGTVNVTAALIESGGANLLFTGAGILNLAGDFSYTSGTFTPGTGTANFTGTGAQSVGGVTYNQLTFNKPSGTASLPGAATVNGNLTLTNGGTFRLNANLAVAGNVTVRTNTTLALGGMNLSVSGDWVCSGSLNTSVGGLVLLNGSGPQSVGATAFHEFDINKPAGTAVLAGNISVVEHCEVFSGTLDLGTFAINSSGVGALLAMSPGSSLRTADSFPTSFTILLLDPASTVEYYGSGNQSVAAVSYGHLILTNGGSNAKTLAGPGTVAGNLLIGTNATFAASSNSLTLLGNWTNNGAFTAGTGTVILNGTNKTVAGTTTFNNMTVGGTYTVANCNINISGNATILGSYAAGSATNTIDGDLFNSGAMSSTGTTTFTGTRLQTILLLTSISSVSSGVVNFNGTISPVLNTTASPQFANVNINNTGGVTASVGWTVFFNFKVAAGASFNGNVLTHTFFGTVTNNGTMTSSGTLNFTPLAATTLVLGNNFSSSGLVAFNGANQITISSGALSLGSVAVANTHAAGITPASNWTLTDDLMIGSGAILHSGAGQAFTIAGSVLNNGTLDGGTGVVVFNGSDGTAQIDGIGSTVFNNLLVTGILTNLADISVSGNFTNNGAFDASGVNVNFIGSSASLIAGTTTPASIDSLVIAKTAATVTLAVNVGNLTALTISSGTLDTATFSVSEDAVNTGLLTVNAGGTLKLGGANAFPAFTGGVALDPASTVEFAGTGAQTITAQNYGNLTSSSTGARTLANSGTVGVARTFTPGANTYTITGSTVDFNGSTAQTIAAFNYNHLTSSSTGARTLANSGTVGVAGTFTPGANTFTVTSSTVNFNGAAQTISAFAYGNLTTSGSGAKTLGGNASAGGTVSLGGGSFADGGFTLTANSDLASSITHSGVGKIVLSGGTTNHVLSGVGAFQNLELSDASGALLGATNLTVNGTLTLTTGTIVTTTNRVIIATAGSVVRTNGYVNGALQKNIATGTAVTRTFEIGDAANYAPVSLTVSNVTVTGNFIASATAGDHPAATNSGINLSRSGNRFWSLTNSSATFGTCNATFGFATNDLDAGANAANFIIARRSAGIWTLPALGTLTTTNSQALALASFGDFQIGQSSSVPAITNQPVSQRINLGSPVTFTVAAAGAATLVYQWRTNGTAITGATNTSLTIASVQDSNAGNYSCLVTNGNGSDLSATAVLTINHQPVANPITYGRAWGTFLRLSKTNVLTYASDPDGDTVFIASVGTSTNGSFISTNSTEILFAPTNNFAESFRYVVGEGSLFATNWITVSVTNAVSTVNGISSTGGGVTISFAGVPGYRYAVERSSNLLSWTTILTTNAPAAGVWIFTDPSPPNPSFYRTRQNN